MSLLTELDVVNDCLSTLGELPVNALDDEHSMIAAARRAFKTVSYREQSKQWWFNTEVVTLARDTSGYIFTPADAIRCDPIDPTKHLIQRGRRMYNPGTSDTFATYTMDVERLQCRLVRHVPFEDLPPSAQITIGIAACMKFMGAYDADSTKYRMMVQEYQEAYTNMNAEHMRNMQTNILDRHSTIGPLLRIRGNGDFGR